MKNKGMKVAFARPSLSYGPLQYETLQNKSPSFTIQ